MPPQVFFGTSILLQKGWILGYDIRNDYDNGERKGDRVW